MTQIIWYTVLLLFETGLYLYLTSGKTFYEFDSQMLLLKIVMLYGSITWVITLFDLYPSVYNYSNVQSVYGKNKRLEKECQA